MGTSKFSSLVRAKQDQSPSAEEQVAKPVEELTRPQPEIAPMPANGAPAIAELPAINMQPPRGKKGNPEYNQVTIYLRKETQNKSKIALLQAADDRDFSELVEELLTLWLAQRTAV